MREGRAPETEQGAAQTSRRGPRARLHMPEPFHHAEFFRRLIPPPMSDVPRATTVSKELGEMVPQGLGKIEIEA